MLLLVGHSRKFRVTSGAMDGDVIVGHTSCIERCKIKYRWGYKKGMRSETVGYESNRESVDEMDRVERVYIRKEKSIRQALNSSCHRNSQAPQTCSTLQEQFFDILPERLRAQT